MEKFGPIFFTLVLMVLWVGTPARAEIYLFKDADGHIHFTDSPSSHDIDIMGAHPLKKKRAPKERVWSSSSYDAYIMKAAESHQLSFALIKAVIHAESGFNPKALSPKGAKGLMQLMPVNVAHYKLANPFDPRENIMGGAAYLKHLMTLFKGNTEHALAAYNAGPTQVKIHKGIPPIAETRVYVAKVQRLYRYYILN